MRPDLTRDEILANLQFLSQDSAFLACRDDLLNHAVHELDIELAQAMLSLGANPNYRARHQVDGYLHHLAHEYKVTRSTKGERVLAIAEELLRAGANPNDVGANNLAPVNWCESESAEQFRALLIKYGADPKGREFR